MDVIAMDGELVVAGPDTRSHLTASRGTVWGLRFRPGMLPRLLKVPASEIVDDRVALRSLRPAVPPGSVLTAVRHLAADNASVQTAPWPLLTVRHVTRALARGAAVRDVATDIGWSDRTLQRQCTSIYGYGPATLRRVLRFRRAIALLGSGMAVSDAAVVAGYADQPHMSRDVREFAGVAPGQLAQSRAANRSTVVPSGSVTEA
jgi:AraC-like DNA-binding protein